MELHLALEGERAGLPLFCCPARELRVDGRALPARLLITPEEADLASATIEWVELQPTPDARSWRRGRIPLQQGDWSLPVLDLPGRADPGIDPSWGTMRFAASVSFRGRDGVVAHLDTDGARVRSDWGAPERAPGLRVTRHGGDTLPGRAMGWARLPVRDDVGITHVRERVAIRPADLFLAAYEDLAGAPWPVPRPASIDGAQRQWLLAEVARGRHGPRPGSPAVGTDGRGIRWESEGTERGGVTAGDVVLAGGQVAYLATDDGDGWLGNGDRAIHGAAGRIAVGTLADLPAGELVVLRPRDFETITRDLARAGYGPLPPSPFWTQATRRAFASFQRDHGRPETGFPDDASVQALDAFLARLDAAGTSSLPDSVGDAAR